MERSAKTDKLKTVVDSLEQLLQFLDIYLPLANCHVTDFILSGEWEKIVPRNIRVELLSLNDQELSKFPSGQHLPRASVVQNKDAPCCNLDSDLPENSLIDVNDGAVADAMYLNSLNLDEASECVIGTEQEQHGFHRLHTSLEEFVKAAKANTLPYLNILTDIKSLVVGTLVSDDRNDNMRRYNQFMSNKKSYEVSNMSKFCTRLTAQHNINKVVDVGCGLGYLGCDLVLRHGLTVLGVDSSKGRTDAADIRAKCLKKQWLGMIQHLKKEEVKAELNASTKTDHSRETEEMMKLRWDTFHIVTHFIKSTSNLDNLSQQHLKTAESDNRLLVTGLHTCGDLAANLIRLFLSSRSSQVLCNVSCCYNLMTERFSDNISHAADENLLLTERGFPMSKALIERRCCLGSNARMLAAQSVDRTANKSKIPAISLFWRSLLQVILFELVGEISENWCFGKLASKCNTFYEYVQAALKKLNITKSISESDVEGYAVKYHHYYRKIQCFYQLRMCLGPCIESIILLDRLAFLLEQVNCLGTWLLFRYAYIQTDKSGIVHLRLAGCSMNSFPMHFHHLGCQVFFKPQSYTFCTHLLPDATSTTTFCSNIKSQSHYMFTVDEFFHFCDWQKLHVAANV